MLWQNFTLAAKTIYTCKIGPLQIWFKWIDTDLYIAFKRMPETLDILQLKTVDSQSLPDDITWERWVLAPKQNHISILPVMPDRPLVIRPEIPIHIPPGHDGTFFIHIPLWVRISLADQPSLIIKEIPVSVLSNTWFGDVISGDLCYAKNSLIRKDYKAFPVSPWCAICRVYIRNNSKAEIAIERFCISVINLAVYMVERLWTNQVNVVFQGEEQSSQVTIVKDSRGFEKKQQLLSGPREALAGTLIKKSFLLLKNLTGI